MSIRVRQSATPAGKDFWKWSVWLEGGKDELDKIESVKYTLHPTFPNPDRVVASRATNFRLSSKGWGEFNIYIEIRQKNGRVRKRQHWLKLEESRAPRAAETKGGKKGVKKAVRKVIKKALAKTLAGADGGSAADADRYCVFISSGAADMPFAKTLGDALAKRGLVVLMADEATSLPWEHHLRSQLERADSAVFVISDTTSRWLTQEIKAVRTHKLPITTVFIPGPDAKIPPDLMGAGTPVKINPMPPDASDEMMSGEVENLAQRIISTL